MVRSTDRERGTPMTHPNVTVVDHPLIRHKLTIMREATTATSQFRQFLREISLLLAYEVLCALDRTTIDIRTPLAPMQTTKLERNTMSFVSILCAATGLRHCRPDFDRKHLKQRKS